MSSISEMLTPSEIERLRQRDKEMRDYARKAFRKDSAGPAGGQDLEQTARGRIRLRDTGAIIDLFKDANASTIIHEAVGHHWLDELMRDAAHPLAPD